MTMLNVSTRPGSVLTAAFSTRSTSGWPAAISRVDSIITSPGGPASGDAPCAPDPVEASQRDPLSDTGSPDGDMVQVPSVAGGRLVSARSTRLDERRAGP